MGFNLMISGGTVLKAKYGLLVAAIMFCSGCGAGGEAPAADGQQPAADGQQTAADGQQTAAVASPAHPGEEIYQNYCFSCHTPGLSGAPKLGDVEAWRPRIAKGPDLLLQATLDGVAPAMPPRGMCFNCSDEDLAAAVDYMIIESQ